MIARSSFLKRVFTQISGKDLRFTPPRHIQEVYRSLSSELEKFYNQTEFWHGTGRYRHRLGSDNSSQGIIDVMQNIIHCGGLETSEDDWDFTRGRMQSISLSPNRMYARIYSQFYQGPGSLLEYQYGSRARWSFTFMYPTFLNAVFEYIKVKGFKFTFEEFFRQPSAKFWQWAAKFNIEANGKKELPFGYFSSLISDIPNNHGIIFGIKKDTLFPVETAEFIHKYERRICQPIPLHKFSHIEVPIQYCREIEALLDKKNLNLNVVPSECGDIFCRRFLTHQIKKSSFPFNNKKKSPRKKKIDQADHMDSYTS